MDIKEEIAVRFRKFGTDNNWSMAEYARRLEVSPQQLNQYLTGKRIPGNKMKSKLENLGCDIVWLVLGKRPGEYLDDLKGREKEEEKILRNLKSLGLDSWEKINEILVTTLRVAEKMEQYKIKPKGK